jgi:hypothetical protein
MHSPHSPQDVTELEEWLANEQRASVMAARELQSKIDDLEQVRAVHARLITRMANPHTHTQPQDKVRAALAAATTASEHQRAAARAATA